MTTQNHPRYIILSFPAWCDRARDAIANGKTEAQFLSDIHPDNHSNARKAYRVEKAETNPRAADSAQHTPGNWIASFNGPDDVRIFAETAIATRVICKLNTPMGRALETCANARLMASAPQLLAALQYVQELTGSARTVAEMAVIKKRVATAIAAATKGTPS